MGVVISVVHESDAIMGFIRNYPALKDGENGKEKPNDNKVEVKLSLVLSYPLHHRDIRANVGILVCQQVLMSARD
jgi:hypothetical protein